MQNKLIFGAAYYEEYLPDDRLERDLRLMAAAGMNTIRIGESTWSVEEPRYGEFDFSHVIRVIKAAARHGISVIVGTPTYAIPAWLAARDAEILGGNAFGPRQNFDITNPTYRGCAGRIIRKIVSRTATFPNVIGYQIDNETKCCDVKSPGLAAGFRDWLRKRFETVEEVNYAYGLNHWSNSAASFDELPDPYGTVNASYACAFAEYRREQAVEFLRWQAEIVAKYKREDQFITHNFDFEWVQTGEPRQQEGYSSGIQPDMNHYDAAKALDIVGTDIYFPSGDALTGREIAFGGDVMRPLKRDNYLVLESQARGFPGWLPYPGQPRLMALSHIASGANGVMYWPWLSLHNGVESYWQGVLSHDGEPDAVYEEIKETGALLKRLSPELYGLKHQSRAAIVASPEALHALRWFPTEKGLRYNDVLNEFHAALYELNINCDILYDREEDWSGYELLIFPQLYCAPEALIERVRRFVAEGGTVLASFRSFFADEHLKIYHDRQPHGLTDVFGMHYSRFTRSEDGRWMELLEPDRAAAAGRYEHKYWGGIAAATRNRFGKGHAWYLGTRLGKAELKDFLLRVCESAGIEVPALRWPIVWKRAVSAKGNRLCFLFNYSGEPQKLNCPAAGIELLTNGYLTAGSELVLAPWDAAIIREET